MNFLLIVNSVNRQKHLELTSWIFGVLLFVAIIFIHYHCMILSDKENQVSIFLYRGWKRISYTLNWNVGPSDDYWLIMNNWLCWLEISSIAGPELHAKLTWTHYVLFYQKENISKENISNEKHNDRTRKRNDQWCFSSIRNMFFFRRSISFSGNK